MSRGLGDVYKRQGNAVVAAVAESLTINLLYDWEEEPQGFVLLIYSMTGCTFLLRSFQRSLSFRPPCAVICSLFWSEYGDYQEKY